MLKLKHDVENSLIAISNLSRSIKPEILKMTDFIRSKDAHHVLNKRRVILVEHAMDSLISEAETLTRLVKELVIKCANDEDGGK